MSHTLINNFFYERCGEIVFRTSFAQIIEVHKDTNGALFP